MANPYQVDVKGMFEAYGAGRKIRAQRIGQEATVDVPFIDEEAEFMGAETPAGLTTGQKRYSPERHIEQLQQEGFVDEANALKKTNIQNQMEEIKLAETKVSHYQNTMKAAADMAFIGDPKALPIAQTMDPNITGIEKTANGILIKTKDNPQGKVWNRQELDEQFITETNEVNQELRARQLSLIEERNKIDRRKVVVPAPAKTEREAAENLFKTTKYWGELSGDQRDSFVDVIASVAKAKQRAAGMEQISMPYAEALNIAFKENEDKIQNRNLDIAFFRNNYEFKSVTEAGEKKKKVKKPPKSGKRPPLKGGRHPKYGMPIGTDPSGKYVYRNDTGEVIYEDDTKYGIPEIEEDEDEGLFD